MHFFFFLFFFFADRSQTLVDYAYHVQRFAFQESTKRNMRSQLQAYLNFCAYYQFSPFYWAACGKPSYKMGFVFPSGTNRTLACSACAQDISVCVECVE